MIRYDVKEKFVNTFVTVDFLQIKLQMLIFKKKNGILSLEFGCFKVNTFVFFGSTSRGHVNIFSN